MKLRVIEAFGGKCCVCGYNKSRHSLALHHLDPSEKDIGLASIVANPIKWEKIVVELRKCILVCHNCHSEIHANDCETEAPLDAPRFNEEFVDYKKNEVIDERRKVEDLEPCPICGGDKPRYNKTCSYNCAAKLTGKVDWDNIDLAAMKEELGSYTAVAGQLDISEAAVRKRWKKIFPVTQQGVAGG